MGIRIRILGGKSKGQVYIERDDLAEALIDTGQAERATFDDYSKATAPAAQTPGGNPPLSRMTLKELRAEAVRRGIDLTAGTGSGGAVLKADFVRALS
tara:strand:- start:444 stop:737 length:294 start_codon:yes stop_codon:yes gene_type:complete